MKNLIYLLLLLLPATVIAQKPWYKSSPLDYAWQNVGTAGFSAGEADYTSLAFNLSGDPYVAFQDWGNSGKATVMKFNGTNWIYVGNAGFSVDKASYLSLAFSPFGQPYVAFTGDTYGATAMKFDGTNWLYVGSPSFSAQAAAWISLAFSPSGEPYVAYQDMQTIYYKATVMKFNGTIWVNVGSAGFSAGRVDCTSLAFNQFDGQPYVTYRDWGNAYKATIMKFDGTNWVNVGNAGFSAGTVYFTSLAFSPSGQPCVAYSDLANSSKATVMKFDGTNWVNVGSAGFTEGQAGFTSLAFSQTGQPYVAYQDWGHNTSGIASVMKFDGANWVYVGSESFSAGESEYTSLAFSPSGQPYVAYMDFGINATKATVMKYDSVNIGINELQESRLRLYPNPASDKITIEKSTIATLSLLSIMNVNGQQLITRHCTEPKLHIDVSNLPCGVYFVRLMDDKAVAMGKFIKQ